MGAVAAYVGILRARGAWVLAFVGLVTLCAAPFAMMLGSTTTTSFGAAPGTQSYEETNEIKRQFPDSFADVETAVVQCDSPEDCKCSSPSACVGFKGVVDRLQAELEPFRKEGTVIGTSSYFSFSGDLAVLGRGCYNATSRTMLFTMKFNKGDGVEGEAKVNRAVSAVLNAAASLSTGGFQVDLSGQTASTISATAQIGKIIGMADGTGMIFIVLLFGWQVRSWRLTLIPILNTVMCLLLAQGLIYPLSMSGAITLPSYVPNVCLFLCIALSVDYSFFHLSRFQEVRRKGAELAEAVEEMVTTAGRVVLVSGVVLLFTWLALAAFPVFGTDTLGYCSAITIFCCILVNLINNPALILAFPSFFGRAAQDPWHCCRRQRRDAGGEGRLIAPATGRPADRDDPTDNCYGRIGRAATTCPGMAIIPVVVYLLLLPGALRLFSAELVVGGVAGGSAATDAATSRILADFPSSSRGVPLAVMISAPPGELVSSESFFAAGCQLAKFLKSETGFPSQEFRGVFIDPNPLLTEVSCQSWESYQEGLHPGTLPGWSWEQSVNTANTSALLTITPPFDAFSNAAKELIAQARRAVNKFKDSSGSYGRHTVACFHPMAIEVDAEELTARRFPWVVAVTTVVVFSLIGVRYRAALVPVKLLFTIALPILAVLGAGVFVFQDGALNWTGIPSMQSQGGLVWINPVACSFMLIGFGLDYDIFLFSRIFASRRSGEHLDDQKAIVHSVAATGPVITTAGCIMALAFVGMVAQHDNPFLCQMGFTMISGVLLDTFVVRTLLVPAFLSMAGRYNWWPGKMPGPTDGRPAAVPNSIDLAGLSGGRA